MESNAYHASGNTTLVNGQPARVTGTRVGKRSYMYDAQGRVTSERHIRDSRRATVTRYVWDGDDRLRHVHLADGTSWVYTYEAFTRRVAKTHHDARGVVVEHVTFGYNGLTLIEQTTHTPTTPGATDDAGTSGTAGTATNAGVASHSVVALASITWEHDGYQPSPKPSPATTGRWNQPSRTRRL